MLENALVNWGHLVGLVVWLGGLLFLLLVLNPLLPSEADGLPNQTFLAAAMRFRIFSWGAVAVILFSGMMRVTHMGGFRELPTMIHMKIGIAVLMIVLELINSLMLLPGLSTKSDPKIVQTFFRSYLYSASLIVLFGLVILMMLALGGIL